MATQTVIAPGPPATSGGVLQLRNASTNALIASALASELGGAGSANYSAAFTDQPAATYRVVFVDAAGDTRTESQWVVLTLTTATFLAYAVPSSVFGGGTGGGGGDATLANQVAILAALSGRPISPVARVASGGAVLLYVGDDATELSSTLLSIPVDDPAGAVLAKLQAIGIANLSWGASRSNMAASSIAGTVKTLTASTVDGNPVCLVGVKVRAAGVSPACAPADDYVYQISQRQTHASDLDDFVEIEGSLELRRRTVAIPS